ncbi:3-methyladenine DNA glycosylase [Streptomonospora wellingtoniae]|uniref:3-methyladenine DNA glycosylase n=1 Tax=Streptomonospora wellingtoniae TaxID=3075544 RepID=A0ABU2KZM1_9ACTN|nr:3-methyladenine DNA glycosylase [Streptomonospora sp. DSM 45055]MDT0304631.1 3-methyladenine DNA glycosylase [Streptomonospora sp. DSM 45055]
MDTGTAAEAAPLSGGLDVLAADTWREREQSHNARVDALLAAHLDRRRRGVAHPVEDFLFTYYSHRPAQLRRWHPGPGVLLAGDGHRPADGDWYRETAGTDAEGRRVHGRTLDLRSFAARRGATAEFVRSLLGAVQERPAHLGCFGLHEWAMVYRLPPEGVRHAQVPLRLGSEGTDRVVESHRVRCSHFDAFRFFTDDARPLNRLRPTRESQVELDQPGCLHANMDLYKWAYKLSPGVPGELVVDCFELARDIRELDMRASPYDLRDHGYEPVAIETPEGKAAYVEAQRAFAERANALRTRLLEVCDRLAAKAPSIL